jgi:hypothetical protein
MDEFLAAVIQLYPELPVHSLRFFIQIKLLTILYDVIGKFYKGNKLQNKLFFQSNKSLADVIAAYFLTFQTIVYILMQN